MNIEEKAIEVLKHCKDRNFSAFDKIYFDDGTNMCIYQAIETLLTAYEKEKGENVKLRLQDIPFIEGELKAYKDRVNELKQDVEKEKEKNKELKWKPIKEYDRKKYDWVLVKYFDGDYECVPEVAEKRSDGKWYTSERQIPFEVKYFFDMQEILEEE